MVVGHFVCNRGVSVQSCSWRASVLQILAPTISKNSLLEVYVVVVVVVALYCHLVTSTSEISHQPAHT